MSTLLNRELQRSLAGLAFGALRALRVRGATDHEEGNTNTTARSTVQGASPRLTHTRCHTIGA